MRRERAAGHLPLLTVADASGIKCVKAASARWPSRQRACAQCRRPPPDDDMPEMLDANVLLPNDDDNDARWHDAVTTLFHLIFFVFPKGHQRRATTTPVSDFIVIQDVLQ
jgi:hypothetical protein